MDLTYKPYIRDSAFKTLSIKTPSIVINGYKPKYTTDTKSEESEEASPVESPIEEIKTTQPSTVKHSSKTFKSKEEFKSTMLPIYESILIKKGLNPLFAKALVAQDGLESAWGSKLSGKYNFGGIKGKGTIARTREVINGQDVYINDSFRDFDSIEDYANYKVDLLNNNRYKAFSGDISEFASRVHKGGYATDPNYTNALNNVIASIKHGGVLKFQEGGLLEGKKWVQNWYQNRKPIIKRNIQQNQRIPFPVTESLGYNILTRNMNLTNASVNPSKVPEDAKGIYYPRGRRIYLKEDSASSAVHEWTHSSNPDAQIREINKIKELLGDAFYDQRSVIPDNYLDDAQEIYSRLMQLRHALKIDPNHKFTNEEIEALKQDRIKQEILTNRLKGKKNNSFSTTVFDKNNQVIYSEPFNPEYKYVPEESTSNREYDETDSFNILNRYSTDTIRRLLNDVAQVSDKSTVIYARDGVKSPESWIRVLPEQLRPQAVDPNWRSPLKSSIENSEIDFSRIKTSSNRAYNNDYLNYINNFLIKKGYNVKQRASLLGDIIEESGGDPLSKSKNGTYQGILQWAKDRYRIQYEDPYKELDSQLEYLHNTLSNTTDQVSWTHGGVGSHFETGKQAHDAFHNPDIPIDSIHRAQSFGYVRPLGKEQSYLNRQKVVDQVLSKLIKN